MKNLKNTLKINTKKNIKFTDDYGFKNSLVVKITKIINKYVTFLFKKAIFTGLGTHFLSFCSEIFKINTMKL